MSDECKRTKGKGEEQDDNPSHSIYGAGVAEYAEITCADPLVTPNIGM